MKYLPLVAALFAIGCSSPNPLLVTNDLSGPGAIDMATAPTMDAASVDAACACPAQQVCLNGACVSGCEIDGTVYPLGAANPASPCQSCQPSLSTTAFSNVTSGVSCGPSSVCLDGACVSNAGCDIGGTHYPTNASNPQNACQACKPGVSTTAWSPLDDGGACATGAVCSGGACTGGCFIGGTFYALAAVNPANACQSCQPSTSTSAWSPVTNGSSCGNGKICTNGSCVSEPNCMIGGVSYASGALDPANACQSCQPSKSTSQWSTVLDGLSCGASKICSSGSCVTPGGIGCTIDATSIAAGTINPGNLCQSCQPNKSTTSWSNVVDGTACIYGQVCISGTCTNGCDIAGHWYTYGYVNPANACQLCDYYSSTDWSNQYNGTSCGSGKVCHGGSCYDGCTIGGTKYAIGALNPQNPCQNCQPRWDPAAWTAVSDDTSCGSGKECYDGACLDGCMVGGAKYAIGALNPQDPCEVCDPGHSPTAFSFRGQGTSCGTNMFCDYYAYPNSCITGCFIDKFVYKANEHIYGTECDVCDPTKSTTSGSPGPDGSDCGYGSVCVQQVCKDGCWIGGTYYADGAKNPANPCEICDAGRGATNAWSDADYGTACGNGKTCVAGVCQ